jgi:hypothetical protein
VSILHLLLNDFQRQSSFHAGLQGSAGQQQAPRNDPSLAAVATVVVVATPRANVRAHVTAAVVAMTAVTVVVVVSGLTPTAVWLVLRFLGQHVLVSIAVHSFIVQCLLM